MAEEAPPWIRRSETPVAARVLPHSLEAENYLLGCCLLDGADSIARCLEAKLPAEAFTSAANRVIYEKLVELYQKSPPVDIAVLAEELKTGRQLEAVARLPPPEAPPSAGPEVLVRAPDAPAAWLIASRAVLAAHHPKQDNTTVAIIRCGPEGFVAHAPVAGGDSKTDTETIVKKPALKRK